MRCPRVCGGNSGEAGDYLHQSKDLAYIDHAKYAELVSAVTVITAERRMMVAADYYSQRDFGARRPGSEL